nr:MAG TPA_asm: hypothetical protein [Bacteriophage sp.]
MPDRRPLTGGTDRAIMLALSPRCGRSPFPVL